MKTSVKLEELGILLLGIYLFQLLGFSWWWFVGLFFLPDMGMLGHLVNNRIGAFCYNMFHHKGIAIAIYLIGVYVQNEMLQLIGIVLFSHASFDRIFGYGLKYTSSFHNTHIGSLKKN